MRRNPPEVQARIDSARAVASERENALAVAARDLESAHTQRRALTSLFSPSALAEMRAVHAERLEAARESSVSAWKTGMMFDAIYALANDRDTDIVSFIGKVIVDYFVSYVRREC